MKDKKSRYFLLTAQEDTEIDLKTLHKLLGAQGRFSFGKADKLLEYLGVTPGAVTAFGIINDRSGDVTFAIDKRLLEHEKINCHPLTNEATTTIARDDLLAFAKTCGHESDDRRSGGRSLIPPNLHIPPHTPFYRRQAQTGAEGR